MIDRVEAMFALYRRGLRKEDQERLDRLFNMARRQTAAGVMQSDPDPFRTVVLSMLLELLRELEQRDGESRRGDTV